MKVLLVKDEKGQYINQKSERYNLICCSWAVGQRANEFKEFISLQDALKYYNLIDPNAPEGKKEEEQEEVVISNEENTTEEQPTVSKTESVEEGE